MRDGMDGVGWVGWSVGWMDKNRGGRKGAAVQMWTSTAQSKSVSAFQITVSKEKKMRVRLVTC